MIVHNVGQSRFSLQGESLLTSLPIDNHMTELIENWEPDEWEQYCLGLLQDRHGDLNIMKVPARHKGDLGIDYYCLCDGVIYQCYAVQEPCSSAERADKQKAKITIDLAKFCGRQTDIGAILGNAKIKRWILLAPLHDSKQVNIHITSKTTEVRAKGLSYAAHDFEVAIHDLEHFNASVRARLSLLRREVRLPSQKSSKEEIEAWAQANPLIDKLIKKLRKRIGSDDANDLNAGVGDVVGWFLERENSLEILRNRAPQLHEQLMGVISRHTNRLRLTGPPSEGTPHTILRDTMAALVADCKSAVPNFALASAEQIALGTVADWLLRCPLDFPPYHAE